MCDSETPEGDIEYLCDYSTRDALWDKHRAYTDAITDFYLGSELHRLGERSSQCAMMLGLAMVVDDQGEGRLKMRVLHTCKVRWCAICQWLKQRVWRRRFVQGIPAMLEVYPASRLLFLTLTVKNCPIGDLRSQIEYMGQSFQRLMQRRHIKSLVLGYAKSLEVTKGADGTAHPHFHVLLLVKSTYFKSGNYLSHDDWMLLWRQASRLDYDPYIHIQTIKPKKNGVDGKHGKGIIGSICEVAKYTVKPSDLLGAPIDKKTGKKVKYTGEISHRDWFLELTKQMHGTKAMNLSGVFKEFMSQEEPAQEEILNAVNEDGEEIPVEEEDIFFFNWWQQVKKYARRVTNG